MIVTNAVWEKRNLGVDCNEIRIEPGDEADFLKKELPLNEAEYTVVKIPSKKFDAMFLMKDLGYTYVESSINLSHDLKEIRLNSLQQRIMNSISYSVMNSNDIDELFSEIKKGIFTTDRVYIDPYFTHEQAANRYVNWILDEIERGCQTYKLTRKDDSVGFFILKDMGGGVCYPFLSGMYTRYLNSGLGMGVAVKTLVEAKNSYKLVDTFISSNNPSNLNIHTLIGFTLKKVEHVYIKHLQ